MIMCAVNDAKRNAILSRIKGYNATKTELEEMKKKVEKAFYENIDALTYVDCVTRNLNGINLGGNKTIESINECKNDIQLRKNFFETQLKNAVTAIKKLEDAIAAAKKEYKNLPTDCGDCLACIGYYKYHYKK